MYLIGSTAPLDLVFDCITFRTHLAQDHGKQVTVFHGSGARVRSLARRYCCVTMAALTEDHITVKNMQARIVALEIRLEQAEKGRGREGRKDAGYLTSKKSFIALQNWGGKTEEFEQWHFKMGIFLKEEPGWALLLQKLKKMKEMPSKVNVPLLAAELNSVEPSTFVNGLEELNVMNQQLNQVLSINLTDTALAPVKNMEAEIECNGLACWWKLVQESDSMTGQRLQGLASGVYQPKRVKKLADVKNAIEAWEGNLKMYLAKEKIQDIPESSKILCMRALVPEDLERDIIRVSNTLHQYIDVKEYVWEQVSMRKDLKATGPVPMDCDYAKLTMQLLSGQAEGNEGHGDGYHEHGHNGNEDCGVCLEDHGHKPCEGPEGSETPWKEVYSMIKGFKGGKGGKDGRGKGGKFDGECSHCGMYGHRLRDCYKKDREMQAWRAGSGKGGGKSQYGWGNGWNTSGKGGYQPKGWKGDGGKGGWKGKAYGKGNEGGKGGKAMGLDGWGQQGSWSQPSAWTLCHLADAGTHAQQAKGPVEAPPGLSNPFEVLSISEAMRMNEAEEECECVDENYEEMFPKVNEGPKVAKKKMPNYSKGQMRRASEGNGRMKWKPLNGNVKECNMLQKAQKAKPLNPFLAPTPDSEGWIKVKGVMDSGASESVAPPTLCPHYPVHPSPGSLAGQEYLSASEDLIPNLGEQYLNIVTETGGEGMAKYQIAEVSRPLNAVSEICDAGGELGQQVTFGKHGGTILNLTTGKETHFAREDGVYVWEFWVKPNGGFQRQG